MAIELPARADVVVIGGGLLGTSVAYQLAKRGVDRVLLLEQGEVGAQGATAKCLGGWRVQYTTDINILFSLVSKETFDRFEVVFGADPLFDQIGYLYLATNPDAFATLTGTARLVESFRRRIEVLDPAEVKRRWNYLHTDDLVGATWTPDDGVYGPNEVVQGYARGGRRRGVTIAEGVAVTGIEVAGGRVRSVTTQDGRRIACDYLVNAAGPWSGQVAALAGLDLPVGPLRRHVFMTDAFDGVPGPHPLRAALREGLVARRRGRGCCSPARPTTGPSSAPSARRWTSTPRNGRRRTLERIPVLERANISRGWIGHYALSPDHHAVIGAFPSCQPHHGHRLLGPRLPAQPASGMLVAELITQDGRDHRPPSLAAQPFPEDDLVNEALTSFRHRAAGAASTPTDPARPPRAGRLF